jgi:enoyl-CoA hydratase/carnithine racemase
VDELVEAAQLDRALDALLDRMTRASPEAVAATKRWLQALPGAVDAELGQAAGVLAGWMKREDVRAGARAFLEGQAPPWFAA